MSLAFSTLYRSELVTVMDARCRPHDACCSPTEHSATNEIVFPRRGCFVRHIGRQRIVADPGTVQYFRRDQEYRVSHPVSGGDDCTTLSFSPDLLADAFAAFDSSVTDRPADPFGSAGGISSTDAFLLMQRIRRKLLTGRREAIAEDSIAVDEAAVQLIEAAARSVADSRGLSNRRSSAATTSAHRDLADSARLLLAERMHERLNLPDIARRVHASPFHLARVFRRMTGSSLHQYLMRLRLREALERLAGGTSDLTALALSLGFASHSHFSDAFRRAFGVSPRAYRLGRQF